MAKVEENDDLVEVGGICSHYLRIFSFIKKYEY